MGSRPENYRDPARRRPGAATLSERASAPRLTRGPVALSHWHRHGAPGGSNHSNRDRHSQAGDRDPVYLNFSLPVNGILNANHDYHRTSLVLERPWPGWCARPVGPCLRLGQPHEIRVRHSSSWPESRVPIHWRHDSMMPLRLSRSESES